MLLMNFIVDKKWLKKCKRWKNIEFLFFLDFFLYILDSCLYYSFIYLLSFKFLLNKIMCYVGIIIRFYGCKILLWNRNIVVKKMEEKGFLI